MKSRRREEGTSAVELVLYMPLLMIAIIFTVQFALVFLGNQAASASAREAARVARVTDDPGLGRAKGESYAANLGQGVLERVTVTVERMGDTEMRARVSGEAPRRCRSSLLPGERRGPGSDRAIHRGRAVMGVSSSSGGVAARRARVHGGRDRRARADPRDVRPAGGRGWPLRQRAGRHRGSGSRRGARRVLRRTPDEAQQAADTVANGSLESSDCRVENIGGNFVAGGIVSVTLNCNVTNSGLGLIGLSGSLSSAPPASHRSTPTGGPDAHPQAAGGGRLGHGLRAGHVDRAVHLRRTRRRRRARDQRADGVADDAEQASRVGADSIDLDVLQPAAGRDRS